MLNLQWVTIILTSAETEKDVCVELGLLFFSLSLEKHILSNSFVEDYSLTLGYTCEK